MNMVNMSLGYYQVNKLVVIMLLSLQVCFARFEELMFVHYYLKFLHGYAGHSKRYRGS